MPKAGPSTIEERLHRIEGQIRGVERLVEEAQPAEKVMTQIQAIISSLESVKIEIVKNEVRAKLLESLDEAVSMLK